jgi:predicted GH43/DUF377 family glycosyl hydrolase
MNSGLEHGAKVRRITAIVLSVSMAFVATAAGQVAPDLRALNSPIIFHGDAHTAYRDPAALYNDGWFYLFFSVNNIESNGDTFQRTAWSKSRDLISWTKPDIFTPRDKSLNYSSPGDVIRFNNQWVLCLQTYPRPQGERYGNKSSRIWIMRSDDLEHWGPAELLRVKGPDVPVEKMGRMIDPFLLQDKDDPTKWWCFFKQNGQSYSWSHDLKNWTFAGSVHAGENACVVVVNNQYVLFHSPANGIGVKRSSDLKTWQDDGVLTLGQRDWPWAAGRITAGFVLDGRSIPGVGKYLMFFHGSQYPEVDPRGGFDNFASIGIAWSSDLAHWEWPGNDK